MSPPQGLEGRESPTPVGDGVHRRRPPPAPTSPTSDDPVGTSAWLDSNSSRTGDAVAATGGDDGRRTTRPTITAPTCAGGLRILDLLVLVKDADGTVEAHEIDDTEQANELVQLESEIAEILAVDDVAHLAEAMEPGSVAGVIVWENLWAAPFAAAARRAGGQLVATGRIPIQAIIASLEADELNEGA
jgi:hypothetical protein